MLRDVLGPAPQSGVLVDMRLLSGRLIKLAATPEELERRASSFGPWSESEEDPGRPFTDDECLHWARQLLHRQLNRYEARAARQWVQRAELPWEELRADDPLVERDENRLIGGFRTITFSSLITALHLQLSDAAEQGRLLRRCLGCSRFFFPERPNRYYDQPRCSDAHRRRRFAARRRGGEDSSRGGRQAIHG